MQYILVLYQHKLSTADHAKIYALAAVACYLATQKTQLPRVIPLLLVSEPLPSNGCFAGYTVLALSKYSTIYN
jgi:hypothetical protein